MSSTAMYGRLIFVTAMLACAPRVQSQEAIPLGTYPTESGGAFVATLQLSRLNQAPSGANLRPATGWFRANGARWGAVNDSWLEARVLPGDPSPCGLVPNETIRYPIRIQFRSSWTGVSAIPASARAGVHIESRVVLSPEWNAVGAAPTKTWPYPTTLDVLAPAGAADRDVLFEPTSNFEWLDQHATLEIHVWIDRDLTNSDAYAGPNNRFVYRLPLPMRAIKSKFSRLSPYFLPVAIVGDPPGNQSFSRHAITQGLGASLAVYQGTSTTVTTSDSFGFGPVSYESPTYTSHRAARQGIYQQVNHQQVKSFTTNSNFGPGAGDLMVGLLRPTLGVFRSRVDMDFRFMCGPGLPCWNVPANCKSRAPFDNRVDSRPPHLLYFPMRDLLDPNLPTDRPQSRLTAAEKDALRRLNPLLGNPHAALSEPRYYLVDQFSGNGGTVAASASLQQVTGTQVSNVIENSTTRDQSSSVTLPLGAIASAAGSPLPIPDLTYRQAETTTSTTEYGKQQGVERSAGVLLEYHVGDSDPAKYLCVETYYDTLFNSFAFRDCNAPPVASVLVGTSSQLRLATTAVQRFQIATAERAGAFNIGGSLGAQPAATGTAVFAPLDAGRPTYRATYAVGTSNFFIPNLQPGRYRAELSDRFVAVTVSTRGEVTSTTTMKKLQLTPLQKPIQPIPRP